MSPRTPLLFLAGVPKAGTSSLFNWLTDHPEVTGSLEKETRFFADEGSHVFRPDFNVTMGEATFWQAFPDPLAKARLFVEGTPTIIYSRTALSRIPDLPGAPRCLFVLREPASQIRSLYDYFRDNWDYIPADMGFAEYLEAVRDGRQDFNGNELAANALACADYLPWLEAWRARLGPDRMKICTFDQLRSDPRRLMNEIGEWCDLPTDFYAGYRFPMENQSYTPKSRALQKINIALRGHLPRGRLYDRARQTYRRMNTRTPDRGREATVLTALRREFAPKNARLAQAFDLDLSCWQVQHSLADRD